MMMFEIRCCGAVPVFYAKGMRGVCGDGQRLAGSASKDDRGHSMPTESQVCAGLLCTLTQMLVSCLIQTVVDIVVLKSIDGNTSISGHLTE